MSYRVVGYSGLGADTMSDYYKSQAISAAQEANRKVANEAVDKIGLSAMYAGPIKQAEAEAFQKILESGSAGQMPSPADFAPIASNLASKIAFVGATAGCSAIGPAAPICGAAAGFVVSKIGEAIQGTSDGCKSAVKVNGICGEVWYPAYWNKLLSTCPPGDSDCRKQIQAKIDFWVKMSNDAQSAKWAWDMDCGGPYDGPMARVPGQSCYQQCPGGVLSISRINCIADQKKKGTPPQYRGPQALPMSWIDQEAARIAIQSRYKAEYDFVKTVESQTSKVDKSFVPQCPSAGCVKQVRGILSEGIYESSAAMRTGGTVVTAKKIMDSAVAQANGVIEQSKRISSLEKASMKDSAAMAAENAEKAEFRSKAMKVAAVVAGVAVVAAIGYASKRRSR